MSSEIVEQGDALPDIREQLAQLDKDIRASLKVLNPRQTKFVREMVTNGKNQTQAAIKAGYSPTTARMQGSKCMTKVNVVRAIDLMAWKYQLKHGIDAEFKRNALLDIAANQRDKQSRASVAAINELNRMDGGHKPIQTHNTMDMKVSISYDLAMPSRSNIIEHDDGDTPAIEHSDDD